MRKHVKTLVNSSSLLLCLLLRQRIGLVQYTHSSVRTFAAAIALNIEMVLNGVKLGVF